MSAINLTQTNAKQLLPVITAIAEGRAVQWRHKGSKNNNWRNFDPSTHDGLDIDPKYYEVRVKPEPRKLTLYRYLVGDPEVVAINPWTHPVQAYLPWWEEQAKLGLAEKMTVTEDV